MSQFSDIEDVNRALPHAVGPEKSILSSMLQEPQEFIGRAIEEGLTEEHFYLPAHSTLFAYLLEASASGQEIELVGIIQKLLDTGRLDRVGGPAGLADLYTYSPAGRTFSSHLELVRDKFVLRRLLANARETIEEVSDSPEDVQALLDAAESRIMAIYEVSETTKTESTKDAVESVIQELQDRLQGKRGPEGITTGFEELDRMTNGLKPGELTVLAARPSMGKTSFMMNIVEHVCVDCSRPTMVFSCEMNRKQIVSRTVYARAKWASSQLSRGVNPTKGDLQRIQRASIDIASAKLFIDDQPAISIAQLRAKARRRHREHKLQLIAIDYLQLMKSTSKQASGNREREIAEISAGLKTLAKELSIPIIVLAQLNRGPEQRTGKSLGKPRMADLRESGAIEQDADIVGLLYRSAYYAETDEEKEALAGEAMLVIAKNRNGETGDIPLTFISELMRFETGSPAREFKPNAPKKGRFD